MPREDWEREDRARHVAEWRTFLFVTLILFPGLAVAFVGAYGFVVWMMQLIGGPPVAG